MPRLVESVLVVPQPALRSSSSVPDLPSLIDSFGPSLKRSGTMAEFDDVDIILAEDCDEEVTTPTSVLTPAYDDNQDVSQLPTPPQYGPQHALTFCESRDAVAQQQGSRPCPPTSYVQHNPYSTHHPYIHTHVTFERPSLIRPRNVRGKPSISAPFVAATVTTTSEYRMHDPYSFLSAAHSVELCESPTSSEPTSPTSPNDSTQCSAPDYSFHNTLSTNTISSRGSIASMSSERSTIEPPMHVQETTNVVYPMITLPPLFVIDQSHYRPQVNSMPPLQICRPNNAQQQQHPGYPIRSLTLAQPPCFGFQPCTTTGYPRAQHGQYLCVPSPNRTVDVSSRYGSDNGMSDECPSILSPHTSHNLSHSTISGIEEPHTASVLGSEGMKKKRYRARCPTCSTTPDVKRLRFKRGFTYFVCLRCHFKWRLQGAK